MDLKQIVRPNIYNMKPYSSARDDFKGDASIFLDANENPHRQEYNRYPDPRQQKIKERLSCIKKINTDHIFLGNGSDEAIDLIFRIFCEPSVDNVIITEPTYGMYEVCANINNVAIKKVLLNTDFSLNTSDILNAVDKNTKVIFICSPNNPTANLFDPSEITKLIKSFKGIVVIDEAYIDFSAKESWIKMIDEYPNLIVIQTLSKAWGLAAIRLGMAFASKEIIGLFNKVKYPYNINELTQEYALAQLSKLDVKEAWVKELVNQRNILKKELQEISFIKKIYPSDANYLLIKVDDAPLRYQQLASKGIIVRNRNTMPLCSNCLRITIGTENENKQLLSVLKELSR